MRRDARCSVAAAVLVLFGACSEDGASVEPPDSFGGGGSPSAGAKAVAGDENGGNDAGDASGGASAGAGGVAVDEGGAGGASGASEAGGSALGGAPEMPFPEPTYPQSPYPAENPDSEAKALLGKILFWDEQLGGDATVACGTCHRPNAGGSDPRSSLPEAAQLGPDSTPNTLDDVHGSLGVVRCDADGDPIGQVVQVTPRKAPTYLDAMFAQRLFWDGRAECRKAGCPSPSAFEDPDHPGTFPIQSGGALENQAVGPPISPVEMACEGATWTGIHQRLAAVKPLALAKQLPDALTDFIEAHDASYPKLFQAAFGDEQTSGPPDEINTRRIAFAIATHERRLRSNQTPWDRYNAGDSAALTTAQQRGLDVFMNKGACEGCHRVPFFADGAFHFIGFHVPSWDEGRKAIDEQYGTPGSLRTPTLRNVGLREASGLLHNGAGDGASLARIIDLYDKGGLLDDERVTSVPIDAAIVPLELTPGEKADLLDFLQHGLDDPRVKSQEPPFDRPLLSTE